ncbi:unnamed protein product [Caenorhabditis angaria]|uniref:Uncharacterized protein n=1 Tax=Caenorhabditis angaria TaxID=860376 RepID=A0A9P1IT21_9PELO|nr:unnamed protein product [Caenorhabditis angaria]
MRNALKEQEKKNEHLERELEERDLEIIRVQMLNDRLHMQTREVEDIDDRRAQIYFETLDKLKRYRKHVDNMAYEISKLRNEKSELQRYIETLKTEIFNLNYERNEEMVQQRHRWAYKNNVLDNQITFSRNFIDHLQTKARFETRQREIDYLQKVDDLYQGRRNLFNYSPHPELEIPSTPSSQSELLTSDFEHLENFQLLLIDTASVASTNNDLKSTDIAPPPGLSLPQPQSSSSVSYFYTPGRQSPPKFDINNLEDFPEL